MGNVEDVRNIDDIYTKGGIPLIALLTRIAFAGYFLFATWALYSARFTGSELDIVWVLYLLAIYLVVEKLYAMFMDQGIDLTFAFPLLFCVYCLNMVSMILSGQEKLPILNRAEHFASFVLIAFVVWVFFSKYLPHETWHDHPYYTALIVLAITSLAGVGNEIFELIFDRVFQTRLVGNQYDTSLDLLMNALGSGLFLGVRLILGTLEDATD